MNSLALSALEVSRQDAASELLRRRIARSRLLDFTLYTKPDYETNWHHVYVCRKLDAFLAGRIRRLMLFQPPRSGKSELVSRRLPALALGQNPDHQVIACSHTAGLASDMNRDVQRIIDDDEYRRLFPGTTLFGRHSRAAAKYAYQRNSDMFEVVGRLGYYRSAGVGGAIAGKGFTLGIIDDPFANREAADSSTQREAIWKWYNGDFLTRAGTNAGILLTHTRFHKEDLAGRLLKLQGDDPKADKWEVVCFPAICEQEGREGDPRKVGEALWPARKTVADLEAIRAASAYEFWAQHQQHPMPQGGVEWPEEYFADVWFDEWPANIKLRALALDPSKGKSARAGDPSAFVWAGVCEEGRLWVDADVARRPTSRIVEDGLLLCDRWRPHGFAIEINQYQELLAGEFRRMHRGETPLPLYGITNTLSKEVRIRQIGPLLAQRRIRFKAGSAGARVLVNQLREFTGQCYPGVPDDAMDALQMTLVMIRRLVGKRGGRDEPKLLET